jgi:putative redox protein
MRSMVMEHGKLVAEVTVAGDADAPKYVQHVRAGRHSLLADEHASAGGTDAGPSPFDYVLAGLGACTSITLRMYAERKAWDLGAVTVRLKLFREETGLRVERDVAVGGELSDDQRARLADICERTPVTLALKGGVGIRTTLR